MTSVLPLPILDLEISRDVCMDTFEDDEFMPCVTCGRYSCRCVAIDPAIP